MEDWGSNNFMLQFHVDNAPAWYDHVKPIIEAGDFGYARVTPPGAVVGGTIITHVVPTEVLLIFIQTAFKAATNVADRAGGLAGEHRLGRRC